MICQTSIKALEDKIHHKEQELEKLRDDLRKTVPELTLSSLYKDKCAYGLAFKDYEEGISMCGFISYNENDIVRGAKPQEYPDGKLYVVTLRPEKIVQIVTNVNHKSDTEKGGDV